MTSDRSLDPFLRQLEDYSDEIFRGRPAPANELDSTTRGAVQRLRAIDRIPPLDQARMRSRKDELMNLTTSWPLATEPLAPVSAGVNGAHPIPIPFPERPSIRPKRSMWLPLVSAAVLIALVGGLIFGVIQNRNDANPTVPAVIQGSPSPEATSLGSDWGQFRGGVERTGYTSDPGPGASMNLQWSFDAGESLNSLVEAGNSVFAYGSAGSLYAIDAFTGEQRWVLESSASEFPDPGFVPVPAAVDGVVYIATPDGSLYAVNAASGEVQWQKALATSMLSSPFVEGGLIYVAVDFTHLLALDLATGDERWSWEVPGRISTQYATVADGKLFVSDDTLAVHALDAVTGEHLWSTENVSAHRVSAYLDGKIYAPGPDGRLTAIDAQTGAVIWTSEERGVQGLNPIATADGIILAIEGAGLRSLNPTTGIEQWTFPASGLTNSPHAGGSSVYAEIDPGTFVAIDLATGVETGRLTGAVGAGSTVAISGTWMFVSGRDGPVRAYSPAGRLPATVATASPDTEEEQPQVPAAVSNVAAVHLITILEPEGPFGSTLALMAAPDGTLWRANYGNTIDVLDRDLNLIQTRQYGPNTEFGDLDFVQPGGVGIGVTGGLWLPDGRMFIADPGNSRIAELDAHGKVVGAWGTKGSGDGQFLAPAKIVLTPDGELAVADIERNDVQWFDLNGNFLRKLDGSIANEPIIWPIDIAYDEEGNFWLLEIQGSRLTKFDRALNPLLTIGGGKGDGPDKFNEPWGIVFDANGNLWISDQQNRSIKIYDLNGNYVGDWDACETSLGCMHLPDAMYMGSNGFLYLHDWEHTPPGPGRLLKFHITSIPEAPMMAAATPVAPPEATPAEG